MMNGVLKFFFFFTPPRLTFVNFVSFFFCLSGLKQEHN